MPITVTGPDNITVQFPDGTDASVINDVMSKHFGGPKPPASPLTSGDLARAAARGIPIAGGFANRAIAGAEALAGRGSYAENLKAEDEREAKFDAEHPLASTAADLAGGIAATGGLGATATGARLLGLGGRTLLQQMGRSAASGGLVNAADAYVRGGDPLAGGGAGAVFGAAAPPVARVIGGAVAPAVTTARGIINPTAEAAQRVGTAIERDAAAGSGGLTRAQFDAARNANEPVNLMDLGGDTTRALARSAANTSPEGRQELNRVIDRRFEDQSQRLADDFNNSLNYPTEAARNQAIRDVAENIYAPEYERAWAASRRTELWPQEALPPEFQTRVSWTPQQQNALNLLSHQAQSPEVQQAIPLANLQMRSWANLAGNEPPASAFMVDRTGNEPVTRLTMSTTGKSINLPSLQYWDYIKRALDKMGTPQAAMQSRMLRDNLDLLVPEYGTARASAAPMKSYGGAANAYEAGRSFYNSRGQFDSTAQTQLARMQPQERALFQDGYTQGLIERVNATGDRQNVVNKIYNTPAARRELVTALGRPRADQLEARLHLENVMDIARPAVQGNSTTARQLAELGLAGGASAMLSGGNPLSGDPEALMSAALMYSAVRGLRSGVTAVNERVSREVARLLASNNPQHVRLGMNMLTRNPGLMNSLRQADAAIARTAAAQVNQQNRPAVTFAPANHDPFAAPAYH